jgi:hypothetical protein
VDGGGGSSAYVSEPSYQRSVQNTGLRSTPDVAYNADPNTGYYTYVTDPAWGYGSWYSIGGTSAGTPQWAGLVAIADQGRALAGQSSLDGATQTLPAIYSLSSNDFHHPLYGSNGLPNQPNYDQVTGRGSPVANLVIADLAHYGVPTTTTTTTTTTTIQTPRPSNTPTGGTSSGGTSSGGSSSGGKAGRSAVVQTPSVTSDGALAVVNFRVTAPASAPLSNGAVTATAVPATPPAALLPAGQALTFRGDAAGGIGSPTFEYNPGDEGTADKATEPKVAPPKDPAVREGETPADASAIAPAPFEFTLPQGTPVYFASEAGEDDAPDFLPAEEETESAPGSVVALAGLTLAVGRPWIFPEEETSSEQEKRRTLPGSNPEWLE